VVNGRHRWLVGIRGRPHRTPLLVKANEAALSKRFEITHQARGSRARTGVLHTAHGDVETPFVGVLGSAGSANGVGPAELRALGASVLFASTSQILIRPGADAVRGLGGLHRFLAWDGPLLTDSGRALPEDDRARSRSAAARLVRVDDDGLTFTSHIDGTRLPLTPESSVAAQEVFGADIALALDPPPGHATPARIADWARRALAARTREDQMLYGVVSDGPLASRSAQVIGDLPFDGVTLPGDVEIVLPILPQAWPRHLVGSGGPADLFAAVAAGVDQLDCTAATRLARNGQLYTPDGVVDITSAEYRDGTGPIQVDCGCYVCRTEFARGYVHHLFGANELLGPVLASIHNLWFIQTLLSGIRRAIRADALAALEAEFASRYGSAYATPGMTPQAAGGQ
jgi:queuine tRNA-ribosyltransferase